jgi:hypothetical protein
MDIPTNILHQKKKKKKKKGRRRRRRKKKRKTFYNDHQTEFIAKIGLNLLKKKIDFEQETQGTIHQRPMHSF